MIKLLNIWVQGAVSEIVFYIAVIIVLLPFTIIDAVILRKISHINPAIENVASKKYNRVKMIVSTAIMIVVAVSVGCIMQFAIKIDIFEDDLSFLLLFILSVNAFAISMCIFDLVRYFKLKKLSSNSKTKESNPDKK